MLGYFQALQKLPFSTACHVWGSGDALEEVICRTLKAMVSDNSDDRLLKTSFRIRGGQHQFLVVHHVHHLLAYVEWLDGLGSVAQVLQALSKIVPILSLLPVALVQSIVGYTGAAWGSVGQRGAAWCCGSFTNWWSQWPAIKAEVTHHQS